jgi:hypothetical protein
MNMRREVAAELEVEVTAPTTLEFQIAVAPHPNTSVSEALSFVLDGDHPQQVGSNGSRRRRAPQGLDRPIGVDRLTTSS